MLHVKTITGYLKVIMSGCYKDMQNQGIARQMILHVFDVMRKDGKRGAHILVKTGHEAALALYGNLGFKTVGECFMFGKDFICMEVKL